jgi:hypothetical protein
MIPRFRFPVEPALRTPGGGAEDSRRRQGVINNLARYAAEVAHALVRPNLVLRAGAGIFYDLGYSTVADGARAFPFGQSKTVLNTSFPLSAIDTAPDPLTTTPLFRFFRWLTITGRRIPTSRDNSIY